MAEITTLAPMQAWYWSHKPNKQVLAISKIIFLEKTEIYFGAPKSRFKPAGVLLNKYNGTLNLKKIQ